MESDDLATINGIKPNVILKDGETCEAKSKSSSGTYTIKRTYDHFYCTCPAWRISRGPVNGRTCKHLKELLGEKYEAARMQLMNPDAPLPKETRAKAKKAAEPTAGKVTGSVRAGTKRKTAAKEEEEEDGEETEEVPAKKAKGKATVQKKAKVDEEKEDEGEDALLAEYAEMEKDDLENERSNLLKRLERVDTLLADAKGKKPATKGKKVIASKDKAVLQEPQDDEDEEEDEDGVEEEDDDEEEAPKKVKETKERPDLLLAEKWDFEKGIDPTDWLISEKLDGVRAFWSGKDFRSRDGNVYYAPDWFVKKFPKDVTLDGELTAGRGSFQECVSIVKARNLLDKWKFKINYHVFDVPSMGDEPFEERQQYMEKLFGKLKIKWVVVVAQTKCESKEHLLEELDKVQKEGGEGLMLREPRSVYVGKRSKTLLKVKTFLDDDAEIIGYEKGKGRLAGLTGALRCRMITKDGSVGKEFKVGTGFSDKQRTNPPKIGEIISYRYFELTKDGVPRFPSYIGVRADDAS